MYAMRRWRRGETKWGALAPRAGGTVIEFALTLPLLALLLLGIIQYGFIFAAYMTLRNASAVAARHAVLNSPTPSATEVQNVAIAAIQPMLNPANLQPPPSVTQTTLVVNGTSVTATNVTLTYDLPLIIRYLVVGQSAGKYTLRATTIMR